MKEESFLVFCLVKDVRANTRSSFLNHTPVPKFAGSDVNFFFLPYKGCSAILGEMLS